MSCAILVGSGNTAVNEVPVLMELNIQVEETSIFSLNVIKAEWKSYRCNTIAKKGT